MCHARPRSGHLLLAFGKTTWKALKDDAQGLENNELLYQLMDSSTLVFHNNSLVTLLEVMEERRKTNPACKVAYHTVVEDPALGPGAFRLELVSKVVATFTAGVDDGEEKKPVTQHNAATHLPGKFWDDAQHVGLVWTVKWAAQGLMPVRPTVVCFSAGELPAGKALPLKPEALPGQPASV